MIWRGPMAHGAFKQLATQTNWGELDYVDFESETLYLRDLDCLEECNDEDLLNPLVEDRFDIFRLTADSEPLNFLPGDPTLVLPAGTICVGYNDHNGDSDNDDLIFCLFRDEDNDLSNTASQAGSVTECTISFDGDDSTSDDAFDTIDPERFVFIDCIDELSGNALNPIYNVPPNVKIKVNNDGTIAYKPESDVVRIDPPYTQKIQIELTERFDPGDLIGAGLSCTCTVFNPITDPDETDRVDVRTYRVTSDPFHIQTLSAFVEIVVKPGTTPNTINLIRDKKVPVAILTTPEFDATTVNAETVYFAGAPVITKKNGMLQFSFEDVDSDGDLDWMGHFLVEALQLTPGDTQAGLEGNTNSGDFFAGSDSVRIIY